MTSSTVTSSTGPGEDAVGAAAAAGSAGGSVIGPDGPGVDLAEVERFALKVATDQAMSGAGALAWVGDKLGLWAAIAASGPVTSAELASATGLAERYLREWLAAQFAAGYLRYDPAGGRFHLPTEWALVLADPDSPAASAGGFESLMGFYAAADRVADAFRTGGGIAWGTHDERLFSGVDRFFRALYAASLVSEWLPALDGIVERLRAGAKVLDVGCGHGASTIMMAEAFPASTFHGIDVHPGSVRAARNAANRAGVADWTTFAVGSATEEIGSGYDLICYFDSFHHIRDAVAAAAAARRALADGGALMLVEPRADDQVENNTDVVGLTFYAASALVCIPDALSQEPPTDHGSPQDVLGGQAGPGRLAEVLTAAGFGSVRVAAEGPVNLIVEARA